MITLKALFFKTKQQMKIFLSLMVVYCMGMALYYFISQPEQTHQLIFWSMLTLFNYQSLININQNKDE